MKNAQPPPNETTAVSNPRQPALQAVPVRSIAVKAEADPLCGGEVYDLSEFSKTPDSFGILRLIGWPFQKFAHMTEWFFGVASMICLLTLCAAIPLLQFITLGYLLEISANIVRQ